jgi:predicted DNA-binding protein with PD1-like motif
MNARLLHDASGLRSFALVFEAGDRVMDALLAWVREQQLSAASFTGIGAFGAATLGYFDIERRDYARIEVRDQVEVLSLAGNVALSDGSPKVHAHVVVGKRDGTAHGGHLLEATVRPTLELVVTETPATLRRRTDAATGLALLDIPS